MNESERYSSVDRIPPQSLPAEMAVLGAILGDRTLYAVASEIIRPTDFYAQYHETLFVAMGVLHDGGKPIDKIAVAEELRTRGMLEKIGGLAYLSQLMDAVGSVGSVEYYSAIVREKATLRGLIHAGSTIAALGYNGEADALEAQAEAEAVLAAALRGEIMRENPLASATGIVGGDLIDEYAEGKKPDTGLTSPWPEVDDMTGGFQPREVIGWIAAPKIGKSGIVLTLADFTASRYAARGSVALFANENGRRRTVQRHLALRSGVSARKQRNHDFRDGDVNRLIAAHRAIGTMPLYVFDHEYNSLAKMNRALRELRKIGLVSTIILDHVGELEEVTNDSGKSSKHERIERAYRALRRMAIEFECPVHFVQHLNRSAGDGVPDSKSFKHIRDGGNVEGQVDVAIFAHRDNPLGTQIEREMGVFVIALTRDGEGGLVAMQYQGHRNLWLQADANGRTWFDRGARAPSPQTGMKFSEPVDVTGLDSEDALDNEQPFSQTA